jgi:hypothetical protein
MRLPPVNPKAVFLNIPYDQDFHRLYLAYIVGISQLDLVPFIASGIPGGERRLDRVLALIQTCRYSIHDLSRAELSVVAPATPRFNMPLELGLTITWAELSVVAPATPRFNMPLELGLTITWAKLNPQRHTWFLWESTPRRIQKSMSDLDGTDAYIHSGTVEGVLGELRNALVRDNAPTMRRILDADRLVESNFERILIDAGTTNPYSASVFRELCFAALDAARGSP